MLKSLVKLFTGTENDLKKRKYVNKSLEEYVPEDLVERRNMAMELTKACMQGYSGDNEMLDSRIDRCLDVFSAFSKRLEHAHNNKVCIQREITEERRAAIMKFANS